MEEDNEGAADVAENLAAPRPRPARKRRADRQRREAEASWQRAVGAMVTRFAEMYYLVLSFQQATKSVNLMLGDISDHQVNIF